MPVTAHTVFSATCDVCGEAVTDMDSEAVVCFDTEEQARAGARASGWLVTRGRLICPERDDAHQAAFDGMLPDLQPADQLTFDGGD